MNKGIIVLVFLVLLLSGIFAFVYFKYQRPLKDPETSTIFVSAEFNGRKVITGFQINREEYNTSNIGYTPTQVIKNQIVTIENINLPNQRFYKEIKQINASQGQHRVDFILRELESPQIKIMPGNPINISIFSKDFKDLDFCLRWSLAYIFVDTNYTQIAKPEKFQNWDRCYTTQTSLENSTIQIQVSYQFAVKNY
jgi:hypothetical protein